MGARGPIGMTDNVRRLRGTHPERAVEKKAAKPVKLPPGRPAPPPDLKGEGLAEWKRIVPELDAKGLLTKVDRGVLASYCRAWAHSCEANDFIMEHGLVIRDRDGTERKTTAWQMWRESTSIAAALAKELLITPNARLRATMPEVSDGEEGESLLD